MPAHAGGHCRFAHRAHDAGVRFGVGADTGFSVTPFGEWHAHELELLCIYGGLSPLEAIVAATSQNAQTVGLAGKVGVIAPGALADVLVVDGDPSRDISVLQRTEHLDVVMKGGRILRFSEQELIVHPYQRNIIYSSTDLTRAVVRERALGTRWRRSQEASTRGSLSPVSYANLKPASPAGLGVCEAMPESVAFAPRRLAHLNLFVSDVEVSSRFYVEVCGA